MLELPALLRSAVQAARSGKRLQAIDLYLEYVEQDPYNVQAWLELSTLVEDPEDQATALENAVRLRPGDPLLAARLEALRDAYPCLKLSQPGPEEQERNERLYRQALQMIKAGCQAEAVQLLQQIINSNPRDERAWLLLSEVQADPQDQLKALEKVVALTPLNEAAWSRLENLRHVRRDPLKRGQYLEERGDFDQAVQIYMTIATHSRSAVERREANLRIDQIKLRQEADEILPVNPDLNLARLTIGPLLLFGMMVFMQSGLNLFHIPVMAVPGLLSVLTGSLLVAVTGMRPAHPRWVRLFGRPGTGEEPEMHRGLRLLGFALLLAPYTMFLIEAGHRLGILQASVMGSLP